MSDYELTPDQEAWLKRGSRKKLGRDYLRDLIRQQRGCCAWSGVPLRFDEFSCTPPSDHISATLEHNSPSSDDDGHKIVCHFLNDAKNKMPFYLFEALRQTGEWTDAMARMLAQHDKTPDDSSAIIATFKLPPV